jgi:Protein of unknown function (DUF1822)
MLLTLEQLQEIETETIWLKLTPAEIELAQPNITTYSNQTGLNNAHLNQLCLSKFRAWLDELKIAHKLSFSTDELTTIWDVVTGCAIEIGKTRLILIPTDNLDRDELQVPQEWVDLPNWLGDYYLGIQIDLAAGLMNIWGFSSHQLLKERAENHPLDRNYSLDSDLLVTNLEILWMAQDLELNERAAITELPTLSLEPALDLIQQLSIPSPYSPRSNLTFPEWGAILNSPNLRSQLHQTRLQKSIIDQTPVPSFRLIDWVRDEFINTISSGWQTYQPALGITLNQNTIERAKLINLQLDLRRETIVLLIGVIPEDGERMRILVQVYPGIGSRCLPAQLQLSYVDEHGAILRTVTARSNDDCIQLPAFNCTFGTEFNIQLQLYSDRVIERFVV